MATPDQQFPHPPDQDELKVWEQQRAQVAAHLKWLDSRIESLRIPRPMPSTPPGGNAPEARMAERPPEGKEPFPSTANQLPPRSALADSGTIPVGDERAMATPVSPEQFEEGGERAETLRSARVGCTILGVLAIGGTIFFFFVLPYWIFR
jgi:hypothetical protein